MQVKDLLKAREVSRNQWKTPADLAHTVFYSFMELAREHTLYDEKHFVKVWYLY